MLFALSLPVIIGFSGLGFETGYWQFQQRKMQTAADMAAYAGAIALRNNEPEGQAHAEARTEAELHGYDAAVGAFDANTPPLTGDHRDANSVEVVITHTAERFVSQMFNDAPVTFSVRAVATHQDEAEACILALSPEASSAVEFFGSANINLIECEVMSNSIAPDSLEVRGSTDVIAPCLNSVGGFLAVGGADYELTDCREPRTDLPPAADPFAHLEPPVMPSNCSNINGGGGGGGGGGGNGNGNGGGGSSGPTVVSPGPGGVTRFCNGLSINSEVVFEPGVYVIDGGDFRINANADVYGEGVTFYLTGGAEANFNGSARIDVTAPDYGDYDGVAFFGDRADVGVSHTFNGTADSAITGAIYTPTAELEFLGDFSGFEGCLFLVGDTIRIGGNAQITTDCSLLDDIWAEVPSEVRLVE